MELSKDTLCIICANVCNGGCSWSDCLEPVKGWHAEENPQGYFVIYCPQFMPDCDNRNRPAEFDHEGMMALMEGVAKVMRQDYLDGRGRYPFGNTKNPRLIAEIKAKNRKAIEDFIRGNNGRTLLQLSDPEEVIRMLRTMLRQYEAAKLRMMR